MSTYNRLKTNESSNLLMSNDWEIIMFREAYNRNIYKDWIVDAFAWWESISDI